MGLAAAPLNAHLHFHCVVIDGVFDSAAGGVVFDAATGLDAVAIRPMQAQVRRRLLRVFVRRDLLPHDDAQAMGQREHGGGFSVDASAPIVAAGRAGRERLLRCCTRPPFALDRLRELDPDHLLYESTQQSPGRNGPRRLTPLALLDRFAALVPPPRVHRHRCFGASVRRAAYREIRRRTRSSQVGRTRPLRAALERPLPRQRSPCGALVDRTHQPVRFLEWARPGWTGCLGDP